MNTASETFHYAIGTARLGTLIVATSTAGVAAILMADDADRALRDLRAAFPGSVLIADAEKAGSALAAAIALVDAPQGAFPLPLDLRGNGQELAVWQALRAIPPGETRSYGALAKTLDMQITAQEVGAACAANRIAVAVPCHRVVKADGGISGYRWGVHRKRKLINMEAVA
ncbi:methylated-DNA--[protein]-cysteine S-methyltransferase [Novosphingobium sp. BL-8H]|uniref:methylated-DNA--[protein]-cysteine S-methyltransferase n=1 Tax=Novosphingobium sp. BL-8H TaxID=3127640 RepID=UPI0037580DDC